MLLLCGISVFAQTISAPDIDFGTVSIKGQPSGVTDSRTVTVSAPGLDQYGVTIGASATSSDEDNCLFDVAPYSVYVNYNKGQSTADFTVSYLAVAAGTYTGTVTFTDYMGHDKTISLKLVVTGDAIVAKTTTYQKVTALSQLAVGDVVVFACESAGAVCGPLDGAALSAVTENVSFQTGGTMQVPETAQTFTLGKYNGAWQFTATGTSDRLLLDIESNNGKGAFTYTPGENHLAGYAISFDSKGNANITRSNQDADFLYPVYYATGGTGGRFKPYKNGVETAICLYKKAGEAETLKSSVVLTPAAVDFGSVELSEQKTLSFTYTAENLTDDILWMVSGADAACFAVKQSGDRKAGTVELTYNGTVTVIRTLSATLAYLTQNTELDPMSAELPISISLAANTIRPEAVVLDKQTAVLPLDRTLQLSCSFLPVNTTDQRVTWTSLDPDNATVDDKGLVTPAAGATQYNSARIVVTSVRNTLLKDTCKVSFSLPVPETLLLTCKQQTVGDKLTLYIGQTDTVWGAILPEGASQTVNFAMDKNDYVGFRKDSKYIGNGYRYYALLTGKAVGSAVLMAAAGGNSQLTRTLTVEVLPVLAETLAFNPAEAEIAVDGTFTLNPVFTPAGVTDRSFTCSGYDETIVSVTDGVVKGLKEGTTTITATTVNGKTAQLKVTVTAKVWYTLVTDPATLRDGDCIVLARNSGISLIASGAGADNLTVDSAGLSFEADKVASDKALVLTLVQKGAAWNLRLPDGRLLGAEKSGSAKLLFGKNTDWTMTAEDGKVIVTNVTVGRSLAYNANQKYLRLYSSPATMPYVFVYTLTPHAGQPTDLHSAEEALRPRKVLRNGQVLIILPDGRCFNLQGVEL